MVVRTYEARDREEVIRIWREVFAYETPHNAPELALEKKLDFGDGLLYVAEEKGEVVGTVMGGYDGHRGWIYSLAVMPASRRSGIATQLVRTLFDELTARGCVKVNLQIVGTNRDLIQFYEGLGFAVEDRVSMGLTLYHGSAEAGSGG